MHLVHNIFPSMPLYTYPRVLRETGGVDGYVKRGARVVPFVVVVRRRLEEVFEELREKGE